MPTDLELARHLVEGDLLDAGVVADLAREQVIDALFALLRWEDGAFRFEAVPRPSSAAPRCSTWR
jgi:hypothetical protein